MRNGDKSFPLAPKELVTSLEFLSALCCSALVMVMLSTVYDYPVGVEMEIRLLYVHV